jgi:predicted dehydrogenase
MHCASLSKHKDFELVAIADPMEERRREAASVYGCRTHASHRDMLDAGGLDVVFVASPTHLHKSNAIEALRAGLHVFLEKPMALNATEARAIIREAEKAKRVLTVCQPHRAMAYFQHALSIIRSGRLGTVYHIKRADFRFVRRNDWQAMLKYGGGMLNNYGAHFLDQLLTITGSDIQHLYCHLRRVASLGDSDDVVNVIYDTRNGMVGELEINEATLIAPYDMVVYGTHGVLQKEGNRFRIRYFSPKALPRKKLDTDLASSGRLYPNDSITPKEEVVDIDGKYAVDYYADFSHAIRTGAQPMAKPRETLAVMLVLAQCRKASGRIAVTAI